MPDQQAPGQRAPTNPPPASSAPDPEQHDLSVPADDSIYGDNDSAYEDETASLTQSLTSSVRNFVFENGRTYASFRDGRYMMPNDEKENDRLDMHHHLATLILRGKLHRAPIAENPQRVLDVGTGTGIWAIEMGDEYPSAEILGIDLSPTQPTWVPPNVKFEVDDIEEPWTFQTPFDLVHCRFLAAAISNWPKLIHQAFEHTKPGGWAEFKDWDMHLLSPDKSLNSESRFAEHHRLLCGVCESVGQTPYPGGHLKGWLEEAGFINVQEECLPVPIGPWPKDRRMKEIGAWNYLALVDGLEAITMRPFTNALSWKPEEVQVLLAQVRNELKQKRIHTQYTYFVVWGQKPPSADD